MPLPRKVKIREVGPREGFQIHPGVVPTERKLELIAALIDAGLQTIEVTSFVRPDKVPQMADADELTRRLPVVMGVEYTALYLNIRGFERAESTGRLSNVGWLYSSPSNSFLRANSNTSVDETVSSVPEWIAAFGRAGKPLYGLMVSTAFGCELEGAITTEQVVSVVERFVAAAGQANQTLREVCLADTVGRGDPETIRRTVRAVRHLVPEVSLHLHDTWGLGLANTYAGLLEGVCTFETSVGGMGGCPFTPGAAGNVATEDVVYLCSRLGIECDVDLDKCCRAARLAESLIGASLSGMVYKRVAQR